MATLLSSPRLGKTVAEHSAIRWTLFLKSVATGILKIAPLSRTMCAGLALVLLSFATVSFSQALPVREEISVALKLERFITKDGQEQAVATERAAPGERLQYVATYSNNTHLSAAPGRTLSGINAVLPVPSSMRYLGAAKPLPSAASLDGKVFSPYPLTRSVKQADGSTTTSLIPWAEYRAIRWSLPPLAAQSQQLVSAGVQMLENTDTLTKADVKN